MRCAMGWLWLVGSIKLQVSFAKEPYKRDNILQKRPVILSILLTVATPYPHTHKHIRTHTRAHIHTQKHICTHKHTAQQNPLLCALSTCVCVCVCLCISVCAELQQGLDQKFDQVSVKYRFWVQEVDSVWGGYGQQDRLNLRSLLQNIVSFIGLFCKRDL